MSKDDHVLDLLPAYALGSLEEEEARLVSRHLAGCYLCRRELDAYQGIADKLPLAAPNAHLTPGLKARLMERVQGPDAKRSSRTPALPLSRRLFPLGAALGLLLIVLLATSNVLLWQRLNSLEVLTGPHGMRAIALHNTNDAPDASGFIIIGADGLNGVLIVDRLPPLEPAREYQVWLVQDSERTSGGVFPVDENGYRGVRLAVPRSLLTYSSVWVTVEPEGGSMEPTGPQVLNGSLFNY